MVLHGVATVCVFAVIFSHLTLFWYLRRPGMSVSVPLISDPCNQLLEALPFVHAQARKQCHNAIRRTLDDATGEKENVQVMLHLNTRKGTTFMEMVANKTGTESEDLVILTGRQIDSGLAGLLHEARSVTETDIGLRIQSGRGSDSNFSSLTVSSVLLPSSVPDSGGQGCPSQLESLSSATSRSAEDSMSQSAETSFDHLSEASQTRDHWDSDGSSTQINESRLGDACAIVGLLDAPSRDVAMQELRDQRRKGRAIIRQRHALRGACIRLRAVGAFIRNGRNKTKRMLAMWFLVKESTLDLDIVTCIGEYTWTDGWRGAFGSSNRIIEVANASTND